MSQWAETVDMRTEDPRVEVSGTTTLKHLASLGGVEGAFANDPAAGRMTVTRGMKTFRYYKRLVQEAAA